MQEGNTTLQIPPCSYRLLHRSSARYLHWQRWSPRGGMREGSLNEPGLDDPPLPFVQHLYWQIFKGTHKTSVHRFEILCWRLIYCFSYFCFQALFFSFARVLYRGLSESDLPQVTAAPSAHCLATPYVGFH